MSLPGGNIKETPSLWSLNFVGNPPLNPQFLWRVVFDMTEEKGLVLSNVKLLSIGPLNFSLIAI